MAEDDESYLSQANRFLRRWTGGDYYNRNAENVRRTFREKAPGPAAAVENAANFLAQGAAYTEIPGGPMLGMARRMKPPRAAVGVEEGSARAGFAAGPQPTRFKTALGSTYEVTPSGSTIRTKTLHPGHLPTDVGVKPASEHTFYIKPEDMHKVDIVQAEGPYNFAFQPHSKGKVGVKIIGGPDHGKWVKDSIIDVKTRPEVGLQPVEVWHGGRSHHFGNKIVEVGGGRASGLAPRAAKDVKAGSLRESAAKGPVKPRAAADVKPGSARAAAAKGPKPKSQGSGTFSDRIGKARTESQGAKVSPGRYKKLDVKGGKVKPFEANRSPNVNRNRAVAAGALGAGATAAYLASGKRSQKATGTAGTLTSAYEPKRKAAGTPTSAYEKKAPVKAKATDKSKLAAEFKSKMQGRKAAPVPKLRPEPSKPAFKGNWKGATPTAMQARGGARVKRRSLADLLKKK